MKEEKVETEMQTMRESERSLVKISILSKEEEVFVSQSQGNKCGFILVHLHPT